jgi:tetratricopeptide (TPR) repeat protein
MSKRFVKIILYSIFVLIGLYTINRLLDFYIYPTLSYFKDIEKRKEQEINKERRERQYKIFHVSDLLNNNELDSAEIITNELIAIENEPQLIRFKAYICFQRNNYNCASLLYDSVMRMTSVKFADSVLINNKELYYNSMGDKGVSQLYLNLADSGLNNLLKAAIEKPYYYFEVCKYYEQKKDIEKVKLYSKKLIELFPNEKFYIDYYNNMNK